MRSLALQFIRPQPGNSLYTSAMSSRANGSACAAYRRMDLSQGSALAFAADELLDAAIRFVVGHLNRGMLGKIGRGRMQDAADAPVKRQLATTDSIDGHAGGVWRIFDGKFHIDFHRHIAEEPPFRSDKRNLVIKLPRHVIARADMNI